MLWGAHRSMSCRPGFHELVAQDIPVRVYAEFGDDRFRYWMRRLAESRGA